MNPLDAVKFDELTIEDLKKLQEFEYPEGKDIDYKRGITLLKKETEKGKTLEEHRAEFLYDVTSFANTHGGYLLLGVAEDGDKTIPQDFPGFDANNIDTLQQTMENLIQSGISPRIQGYRIKWFDVAEKNKIMVLKIPVSWGQPHMVTYKDLNRFYARNASGKYLMDVEELRNAFNQNSAITESFLHYRNQRVESIQRGEGVFPIPAGAKLIIHLLPYTFKKEPVLLDLAKLPVHNDRFVPFHQHDEWAMQYNFDGVVKFSGSPTDVQSYNQWFRHGGFEVADAYVLDAEHREKMIPNILFERYFIKWLEKSLSLLQEHEIPSPYCLMVTMLGVKEYKIIDDRSDRKKIRNTDLLFPPLMIADINLSAEKILQPIFNWVWNAAGHPKSLNFDESGNWTGDKNR